MWRVTLAGGCRRECGDVIAKSYADLHNTLLSDGSMTSEEIVAAAVENIALVTLADESVAC